MNGRLLVKCWLGVLCAMPLLAHAQARLDLTTLDEGMTGNPTRVLVLGSVHLSRIEGELDQAALDPVLERLVAFRPDVIAHESMSGEECDLAARHPTIYGADFCADPAVARTATGLDVPAAIAEARRLLDDWPAEPDAAQRRRLASVFLAANDRASALVQWWQLPAGERRPGDGLDDALVAQLRALEARKDESYRVGAALAARLGLARIHAVDNHTGDNLRITDEEAFARDLRAAWDTRKADTAVLEARQDALIDERDLLGLYREVNRPLVLETLADVNAGAAMRSASEGRYPQIWVGGWETRNLRMVANIRETFRERPGARVLVIVGVSHKPWFDDWLGQLQGVEIVDVEGVLE